MSSRYSLTIGNQPFSSKKEATAFVREILHQYPVEQRISGEHHEFLCQLLARHPDYEDKRGEGIDGFVVRVNATPGYRPTKGFYVIRTDGTAMDFSFPVCINGEGKSLEQDIHAACRLAIWPSMDAYRTDYYTLHHKDGKVPCELSGEYLELQDMEVDHISPWDFKSIVAAWVKELKEQGTTLGKQDVTSVQVQSIKTEFVDFRIADAFAVFHDDIVANNKSLRLINKTLHRRLKNHQM